jgi:ABC-type sugar transport system ATPase subunit
MGDDTILEFRNISKSFPGVQALDQVSLSVKRGEVHAIVGENGAGKSTLMKIAAGLYQPDGGQVLLDGQPVSLRSAGKALALGVAMLPQELNLVPEMTVAENVLLGIEPHNRLGVIDQRQVRHKAGEILASLGMSVHLAEKLNHLSVAEQQMVQIARAMAFECNILIMDEPTAPLSEREKNALFERLRRLRQLGTTILYISHRMQEIFEIADRITVLRDGKLMRTMERAETTQDQIVSLMIGRSLREFLHERERARREGEVMLEVRGLTRTGLFEDVSFVLHRGEVLGFAGMVGARRTEALSSVFGYPPPDRGEILIEGNPVTIDSPTAAIRLGMGFVPEERKAHGLFLIMSVLHNISLPFLGRLQHLTVIKRKDEMAESSHLSQQLRVQTPSLDRPVKYLSGGNQQKVILARWLGSGAKILILDEPTRGIDINAKAEIHALIVDLAAQGKGIVLISSELHELMAIADRIVVMREGHIVGDIYPWQANEEQVLRLAMWGADGRATAPDAGTANVAARPA